MVFSYAWMCSMSTRMTEHAMYASGYQSVMLERLVRYLKFWKLTRAAFVSLRVRKTKSMLVSVMFRVRFSDKNTCYFIHLTVMIGCKYCLSPMIKPLKASIRLCVFQLRKGDEHGFMRLNVVTCVVGDRGPFSEFLVERSFFSKALGIYDLTKFDA